MNTNNYFRYRSCHSCWRRHLFLFTKAKHFCGWLVAVHQRLEYYI